MVININLRSTMLKFCNAKKTKSFAEANLMAFNILLETSDTVAAIEFLSGSFTWVEGLKGLERQVSS